MGVDVTELLGCPNPWCNTHKTTDAEIRAFEAPIVTPSRASYEFRVCCPVCPMNGPWADIESEAISAWNTRADQSQATLAGENARLRKALEAMLHAVCHETGFAAAVRNDSGFAYPWEPLDIAEAQARAALVAKEGGDGE